MYVCMCVCVFVYVCVCMYVSTYVCMHACMCVYVNINISTYIYIYLELYINTILQVSSCIGCIHEQNFQCNLAFLKMLMVRPAHPSYWSHGPCEMGTCGFDHPLKNHHERSQP